MVAGAGRNVHELLIVATKLVCVLHEAGRTFFHGAGLRLTLCRGHVFEAYYGELAMPLERIRALEPRVARPDFDVGQLALCPALLLSDSPCSRAMSAST
ncbi:hypothetical protein LCGC14_1458180, partial [marine sediment metagenome]